MNHNRGAPVFFYSTLKRKNELLFFLLTGLTTQRCVCWDNMSCDCLWFPCSGIQQCCWGSGSSQLHRQWGQVIWHPAPPGLWLRVETGSKCCLHTALKQSGSCWQFSPAWLSLGTTGCANGMGNLGWKAMGCFSSLVPRTRLPISILIGGGRWGNMRANPCRPELKMLDVVPPQTINLYSHLHLSPLLLLSSCACYSWAQAPVVRKTGR